MTRAFLICPIPFKTAAFNMKRGISDVNQRDGFASKSVSRGFGREGKRI